MTDSRPAPDRPRSGAGCGTAFGIGLIVAGGLFLWVNLTGTPLALLLLDALPLAAVWWPLLLVLWGAAKVVTRLRTGRARFGLGEAFLLLLLVLGGTLLTLAQRAVESRRFEARLGEVGRLVEQQSGRFAQHRFLVDRVVPLPADGASDISVVLPAGNILVETASIPPETTTVPDSPEAPTESGPEPAGGSAPNPRREARVRLVKHVWAADRAEAAAAAEAVRLVAGPAEGTPSRLEFRTENAGELEVALELLLTLPPGLNVAAVSGDGSIRIQGPFADVEARASDGVLEVGGSRGAVSLNARDGAVRVFGIAGDVRIRGRRAVVEVESVAGPTRVESDGAPVWVSGAASSVTIRGRNAPVTVADSSGPVDIETRISPIRLDRIRGAAVLRSDFGDVIATSVEGPLQIRSESATLEVRGARSDVDVQTAGGALVFDDIAGSLTVTSGRGEVRASGLSGPANFMGNAGAIAVRGFTDTLSITGGDAEVDVATSAVAGEIALTTDRGDVRLTLPSAGSFALSAETDSGDVDSEIGLERRDTDGTSRWEGRAGAGTERVTISTRRGDITVEAHPPAEESP
jgi:DUF4097 and DUF4098 domain-containing protein YvlB